jgi:hypothetical protein
MPRAIADALLETLASVEVNAGEAFDLDTSVRVLETAAALLQGASPEEREMLTTRGAALAEATVDPDRRDFLANIGEGLGIA